MHREGAAHFDRGEVYAGKINDRLREQMGNQKISWLAKDGFRDRPRQPPVMAWSPAGPIAGGAYGNPTPPRRPWKDPFPIRELECYTITMTNPLSPTSGVAARLVLVAAVLSLVWLAVMWALW